MSMLFYLLGFLLTTNLCCFINPYKKIKQLSLGLSDDPGEPLFVTKLIEAGKIEQAQTLSEVKLPDFGDVKSYSGYLTVNEARDSNLFFWYFPAESNGEEAPVILWLQGGPGVSSLFGLFEENGPFVVDKDGVKQRKYRWSQNHHVLYIDNPVG